jgi:hypothetical protein
MKQIITEEMFEVVVPLRFASSLFVSLLEVIRKTVVVQANRKRIQKLIVQLWSFNQRTTETEEVTHS